MEGIQFVIDMLSCRRLLCKSTRGDNLNADIQDKGSNTCAKAILAMKGRSHRLFMFTLNISPASGMAGFIALLVATEKYELID